MIFTIDETVFSDLYPFSFISDEKGEIIFAGKSLIRFCSGLNLNVHFLSEFTLIRPSLGMPVRTPVDLDGELIVLARPHAASVRLRGQVIEVSGPEKRFLFSLNPMVLEVSELSAMGMEFSDFAIGDPIFDFLMLNQSQKAAQARLEKALSRVDWENRIARLLYGVMRDTYTLTDSHEVYRVTLDSVCNGLGWSMGRVFNTDGERGLKRSPVMTRYLNGSEAFPDLEQKIGEMDFGSTERKVIWRTTSLSGALSESTRLTGVSIPIVVDGMPAAVLEFFSGTEYKEFDHLLRFFESLGLLLGGVMARLQAQARERDQWANLVSTSKMATLGEISAGVAHEINNPLAVISMVGQSLDQSLERGTLNLNQLPKQISRINACVKRITRIVAGLKDFSRDSSKDPFVPTSVKEVVSETLDICGARFTHHGVQLMIDEISPELKVECRGSQISQILLNLLNNAFDAVIEQKDPWVRVQVMDRKDGLQISVTDSGGGIHPDVAAQIMKPFFTTKAAGKGTGLGLSISSNIAREHQGSLDLDFTGANTRFLLTLPKYRTK